MLNRKPRKGDLIRWPDWAPGRVAVVIATPVDGVDMCWAKEAGKDPCTFLWRHSDCSLNLLAEILDAPEEVL